jgi:hypothetical protein
MTLALAYIALFAIFAWFIVYARGKWAVKLAAIVAMPLFAYTVHQALAYRTGWPTSDTPPKSAKFMAGVILEPREIDLWLMVGDKPRAFKVPYSRQLHKQVDQANAAAKQGVPVGVRQRRSNGQRARYVFYRLPATPQTRKDH